jgi:hypothetical protein
VILNKKSNDVWSPTEWLYTFISTDEVDVSIIVQFYKKRNDSFCGCYTDNGNFKDDASLIRL